MRKLLIEGAQSFGVNLSGEKVDLFLKFTSVLKEWNTRFNLTAIEDDRDIVIKHHLDSISVVPCLEREESLKTLIDVGTGAGFPGIPLKLAREDLDVTLLDSIGKRVTFLKAAIAELNLGGIEVLQGRAEQFGRKEEYREVFDAAVARAVASLPVLLEYCLPFVKVGGIFIAMKGSDIKEVDFSKKALEILGGVVEKTEEICLPFSNLKRNVITVRKIRQTPTGYPRDVGKPSKRPLI